MSQNKKSIGTKSELKRRVGRPGPAEGFFPTTFHLGQELHDWLEAHTRRSKLSKRAVIEAALSEYAAHNPL